MNFGRCRGQIRRAGGKSATDGARDRGDGGRAPAPSARWRPWRRPHWPLPAVSPAPSRGGKCQFSPRRKGGKVPVQPPPEGGGKCQFSPRRKGGESASFSGGDQPPLAASRRGDLAAAEIADPGPARSSGAVWSPALSGPARAFLVVAGVFQRAAMLRLPARLRRFLRLRGWPGIRARWAYATPARCARPTVLWCAYPTRSPYQ